MTTHSLSHLSDASVERGLVERAARERLATAEMLAYLAEFDARKLFRQHLLHSTFEFCVRVLGLSEDMACRRIAVARDARSYPALLRRIADGSLHLTGAAMLSNHLTPANAEELLEEAAHKSKAGIERVLAGRFPRADLPTRLVPLVPETCVRPVVTAPAENLELGDDAGAAGTGERGDPSGTSADAAPEPPTVPNLDHSPALARVNLLVPRPKVQPLAPERFGLQATIDQATHDDLRRAQELLRHQVPDGSVPEVLKRALRLLVRTLESRKFGATDRPAKPRPSRGSNPRQIPAAVRRVVWQRDHGRCTFVDPRGHRCGAREWLEYDHEVPLARGGRTTPGNLRLRCRMHNQMDAEQTYGAEFMRPKRESPRQSQHASGSPMVRSSPP